MPFKSFKRKLLDNFGINSLLIFSFLIVIFIGTLLLNLPIANRGNTVSFIDHFFTATSATCVTGLLTVPMYLQYTLFGQVVVLVMIQIGGLGLMTFIAVALVAINKRLELKEKMIMQDALNKLDTDNVKVYIIYILKFTFTFEALGAMLLYTQFIHDYGAVEALWQSIFTAISAFCNAGIECLGASSLIPYNQNSLVLLTVAFLIISGGLGFGIWFDFKARLGLLKKARNDFYFFHRRMAIHIKIVLRVTLALLTFGFFIILLAEYDNTLAELPFLDKCINAFFNSATLRTAGFYSIDYALIKQPLKVLMIVLMFIGGSPGGTAGGIKTTTFFLLLVMILSGLKQSRNLHIFHRHIPKANLFKAYNIFMLYFIAVLCGCTILVATEHFESLDILFEAVSAIGTVGLSTGITAELSVIGKIVIILLMFIGRVGPVTIAYELGFKKPESNLKYPKMDILVG